MALDAQTQRNLEVMQGADSLLSVIDLTKTPMGGRLLKRWLGQPLLDAAALRHRQDAIGRLAEEALARNKVIALLGQGPTWNGSSTASRERSRARASWSPCGAAGNGAEIKGGAGERECPCRGTDGRIKALP